MPDGVLIEGIVPNNNGSYTIPADSSGDTNVTLSSDIPITQSDLDDITSSITLTEVNGDTSTDRKSVV